jgi:hypothetical protein
VASNEILWTAGVDPYRLAQAVRRDDRLHAMDERAAVAVEPADGLQLACGAAWVMVAGGLTGDRSPRPSAAGICRRTRARSSEQPALDGWLWTVAAAERMVEPDVVGAVRRGCAVAR